MNYLKGWIYFKLRRFLNISLLDQNHITAHSNQTDKDIDLLFKEVQKLKSEIEELKQS